MKKDLLGISIQEKMRILEMHYKASGKKLIHEQAETEQPKKTDWSEGGTKSWEQADIKKIIQYIKETDSQFAFSRSPIYMAMLEWFENHPDASTRESLKAWVGTGTIKKAGDVGSKDYQSTANRIISMTNPAGTGDTIRIKLNAFIANTTDTTAKTNAQNIIKQLDRIYKEYKAFKAKGVFPDNDFSNEVYTELDNLRRGITTDGNFRKIDDEVINLKDILTNLTGYNIISSAKESGNVDIQSDENSKAQIIAQLNVEAAGKLKDKDFLDGFFRGVSPSLEDMITKAKSIQIGVADSTVIAQYKDAKEKETDLGRQLAVRTFSYPQEDLDDAQRNTLAMNMFPDDGDALGQEAIQGLQTIVNDALAVYNSAIAEDEGAELKTINIRVYSSTSKVRTQYKSDKYSEQNNVQLATARANVIEAKLKELINETDLSNAENVVTLLKVVDANRGPGWNDQKSVDLAGQAVEFATAYANAPLYTYAHEKYPTLTARQFYGGREEKAAAYATKLIGRQVSVEELETEYENVYAKWRYCMGGIDLNMLVGKTLIETDDEQDFVVAVAGGLSVSIEWKGDGSGKGGKKKKRKNKSKFWRKAYLRLTGQRGGKSVSFKRSIDCPRW
jgi:hypothetical protein